MVETEQSSPLFCTCVVGSEQSVGSDWIVYFYAKRYAKVSFLLDKQVIYKVLHLRYPLTGVAKVKLLDF